MQNFRKTNRPILYLWAITLCISLLFAQNLKLHIHDIGHEHVAEHQHQSIGAAVEHRHISKIHFSSDGSHADQHATLTYETELSPASAILKNVTAKVFILALLTAVVTLLITAIYPYRLRPVYREHFPTARRYQLYPPLRAPPL